MATAVADTLRAPAASTRGRFGRGTPAPAPSPAPAPGTYRSTQSLLLQGVDTATRTSAYGGAGWAPDADEQLGPTATYVSRAGGWPWGTNGGRYLDANQVQQGNTPWASVAANGTGAVSYTLNLLTLVQHAMSTGRWAAIKLRSSNGARTIAGRTASVRNTITYTYSDSTSATLDATCVAIAEAGTPLPQTTADTMPLPCFVEWPKPDSTKTLTGASASIRVVTHFSGNADLQAYLLDPPLNTQGDTGAGAGLAMQAGLYDSGLSSVPGVTISHRFEDGRPETDFIVREPTKSKFQEQFYNPKIWGGTDDTTKWPNTCAGRWMVPQGADQRPQNITVLSSAQLTAAGVTPPGPGLGAIETIIPDQGVAAGSEIDANGTFGCEAFLMVPEAAFGLQTEVWWRYRVWLKEPVDSSPARRREYRRAGTPVYEDRTGKFGIVPHHSNTYGGQRGQGGGGGGFGYLIRNMWRAATPGLSGPDNGGIIVGQHIVDDWNNTNNPAGYRYGYPGDAGQLDVAQERMGQQGGHGAVFYPGRWIEVEGHFRRNTCAPDGSWQPDGILRTWVDGKLAWEKTDMVFATLPAHNPTYDPAKLRPARELGITGFTLGEFHGGQTPSSSEYRRYYALFAYGSSRIGSVRTAAAPALPSWIPPAGEVSTLTQANGRLGNSFVSQCAPYYAAYQSATIVEAYSTTVLNPWWGPLGSIMAFGGGHAATNNNAVYNCPVAEVLTWQRITNPSPIYGSGNDVDTQSRNTGYTSADGELTGSFGPGPRLNGLTCQYLVDGQPSSPHSYSMLDIVPPTPGRPAGTLILPLLLAAGYYQPASNYSVSAYELPLPNTSGTVGSYTWALKKTHETYPSSGQSASGILNAPAWTVYEPSHDRQQYMSRVPVPSRWFDRRVNNYVQGSDAGLSHADTSGTGDTGSWFRVPERGINLWLYKDSASGNLKVRAQTATAQPTWLSQTITLSQALAIPNGWSAACWCSDNKRILVGGVMGENAAVFEIEIPDNLASTWQVVRAPFGASQTINWTANQVYKKWVYNPAIRAILFPERIGNGDTTTDLWRCYKPRNT